MTSNYTLVDFHLNAMIQMLIRKHGYSYEDALPVVMSSETYKSLLDKPYLQEEGSLFICELLERELQAK
jgi:hypothetical protein